MKWLLWVGGFLLIVVCLAAFIGALLPVRHTATRKSRFKASADSVYAAIAGAPDWRSDVKAFGALPEKDGRPRWFEEDSRKQRIVYELLEDRPPTRRATRIAGEGLPFGGAWTFEISPLAGGGSELRIREDGEIYNVIFRFAARYFMGYASTLENYLRDLARKLGETAEIEA
jgi:hypothetical protein